MVASRAPQLWAILGLFLALTWIFTALRVYVRALVSRSWGADDFLLLAALASFSAYVAIVFTGIIYGIGQHNADLPPQNISQGLLLFWLIEVFYTTTTVLMRLSVAAFILRVCTRKVHKVIVYGTIGTVLVFSTFYLLLVIFQCTPASFYWTRYNYPNPPSGSCIDVSIVPNASFVHSVISAIADWILGVLPIWLIWDLKMNIQTKISVGVLLSLGMVAGVAALIRIPFIHILAGTGDFFWDVTDVAIWSGVEPALGIIATAACVLRPLMKRFYNYSSYATGRAPGATTHPSTWRNERIANTQTRSYANNAMNVMEMGDRKTTVTSVLGNKNHKRNMSTLGAGNESEEELTGGIQVKRTVQIVTHEIESAQRKEGSFSSLDSTPIPR